MLLASKGLAAIVRTLLNFINDRYRKNVEQ